MKKIIELVKKYKVHILASFLFIFFFRSCIKSGEVRKLEKRNVDINEEVLVMRGPFYNQQGIVKSIKNNSVVVSLPSLGYSMIAEIQISNIKILNPIYEVESAKYHSLSVC